MARRKIIKIDERKCNGCSLCIPNCPEGAIQLIDGKARLVSDLFCDGLGACLGHCPEGAIIVEERDAPNYDERKIMENIVRQGANTIRAHLAHLKDHNQEQYLKEAIDFLKEKNIELPDAIVSHQHFSCPGSKVVDFRDAFDTVEQKTTYQRAASQLKNWPVQIKLVPAIAPFLNNADLLIAADCVAFTYADFHADLMQGKVLLVGCPKLDDITAYEEKLSQIFKNNTIKSVTCVHMEVPCCFGLVNTLKSAIMASGKDIPFAEITISIRGEKIK